MGITIEGIYKVYTSQNRQVNALEDINLKIGNGDFVSIIGPSGCGKTTLLNIIAGFEKATKGWVSVNEKRVQSPGRDRAFIFQENALFPWLNVIDNVEFGLKHAGIPKQLRRDKAAKYLEMVHLLDFQHAYTHELSGGMKQRAALARALALDSEVLLMDEPLAALDAQSRAMLQSEILNIWTETKKTIIFVTHSILEAILLSNRIIVMTTNPGKITREYTLDHPRPRDVKDKEIQRLVDDIRHVLKEEVEKGAKYQSQNREDFKQDNILFDVAGDLGTDI